MKIARGCWSWIIPPMLGSIIFFVLSWFSLWFLIGFIIITCILIFFLIFFRDPERIIGEGIVAPADGAIRDIKQENNQYLISTFMEINNVHVNSITLK